MKPGTGETMKFSAFGKRFTRPAGITELMDDLGEALEQGGEDIIMLGGGNPARVPAAQKRFRAAMEKILNDEGAFENAVGNYDGPRGHRPFREALADLLRREHGWELGPENVALTNGSQNAFFTLFNLFAGRHEDGSHKKILLPLTPEYIGYGDVGLSDNFFTARRPVIEEFDDRTFKYHINFDALEITGEIGAVCASRPTNPSGNVLTDAEIERLDALARENDVPLILDNAYGAPFPDIIFTRVRPVWNENIILCMSLSKLGIPAARTGIVVAREEIIDAVGKINGVMSLAPTGIGAALATDMVRSGEIISMSREQIRPFYQTRLESVVRQIHTEFKGLDYRLHKPEGAFFIWLWFPGLPITCRELYERLKRRRVLVVSGHHFFPGLDENWRHKDECIRVSYSQNEASVASGIAAIAKEVKRAHKS